MPPQRGRPAPGSLPLTVTLMTADIALTAALRRLHHTHRLLSREETERIAHLLDIPPQHVLDSVE